ncbi:MAG: segregation/condensation protein A [Thermoplasmata archaeon]
MRESYEAVLNHLLFHKALISERENGARITKYLEMIEEINKGMHIACRDPIEKSLAAAFELVIENQFDPWDINLVEFTKMYLRKVKSDGGVNFIVAGRLVLMAWSILKLQSDEVLEDVEPRPPADECFFSDWDIPPEFYQAPEDLDYTNAVLNAGSTPLRRAITRQPKRSVTLIELVDAFDEARREAEIRAKIESLRTASAKKREVNFHSKVHQENLSEDMVMTWSRIRRFNGQAIPLHNLWNNDVWDRVSVFVSVLFLCTMEKVKLWQRKPPYGEIFVKSLAGAEDKLLDAEEVAETLEEQKLAVMN